MNEFDEYDDCDIEACNRILGPLPEGVVDDPDDWLDCDEEEV